MSVPRFLIPESALYLLLVNRSRKEGVKPRRIKKVLDKMEMVLKITREVEASMGNGKSSSSTENWIRKGLSIAWTISRT